MINHDGKKLDKNFRPVQHLHQRNVKYTGDLPLKAPLESILSPRKLEKCRCVMKQKDQMKKEDFEKEVLAIKDDRDDDDDLSPEEFPQEHEEEELEVEIVKQQPSGKVTGGANSRSAHLAGLIVLAVLTWTAC